MKAVNFYKILKYIIAYVFYEIKRVFLRDTTVPRHSKIIRPDIKKMGGKSIFIQLDMSK